MSERRQVFRAELPRMIASASTNGLISLDQLYEQVASRFPLLLDEQPDPPPGHGLKWQHELRWGLETLVGQKVVLRRKDVGRGFYSLPG